MSDQTIIAPKTKSFEQFEEKFIFEGNDYFIYNKYSYDCKKTTTSFLRAINSKLLSQIEDIHLQDDGKAINSEIIRSVAINFGSNVISVCFSSIAMTDKMVEGILPHLCNLQYLQFNRVHIGAVAARAISMFCHRTLISLRISRCNLITSESCGWLAGIIGHNSPRLCRLRALDVSSTKIDDRGVAFLSKGLGRLEYLDLGCCAQLSLAGKDIQESISGGSFCSMIVLNLRGCKGIDDEGVVVIAETMSKLRHLNISICGNITNKSASVIGLSCTQMKTLSLEGALGVTDAGLGIVANHTKLNLLNITGCSISRKSLLSVVTALGYVQESSSFFGFLIRDFEAKVDALNNEEMANAREQQNHAAHVIQGGWNTKRHTIHQMQSAYECHERKAATKIQSFVLNRKSRRRFNDLGHRRLSAVSSVRIQKMIRGWLARRRLMCMISRYRAMTHYATIIQRRYRGKFVRSHDTLVMPAILALRAAKLFERRANAATVLQCFWRNAMAVSKLSFLRRQYFSRLNASILIQKIGRSMLARRRSDRFRMLAEMYYYYCCKMAVRIQCFQRQYFARRQLDKCLQLASERFLTEHNSSIVIQKCYRGSLTRPRVERKRLAWNNAAVETQRIFRGRRVPRWQLIKMDAISQHVREHADFEHANSLRVRRVYMQSLEVTSDETEETPLEAVPPTGTEELLKYVFGHSFVKLPCLIYWPEILLYKSGSIGGYDDRMRLWQIDYDEDDNEWLDLARDQGRVMVMEEKTGSWIPFSYCRPLPMVLYLEKRKSIEPSNSTWTPQESREQISSEIWYLAYVARGLLDECYHTQSHEAFQKLKDGHIVKAMTVCIAKVKYMCRGANNEGHVANEMKQFEHLLREVEVFIHENLADK